MQPVLNLDISYEKSTFIGTNDETYSAGFAIDNINNWYKLKLSKYKNKKNSYRIVDMYLLQLASLIVCRGKHSDKTNQFVELLLAQFEAAYRNDIYFENQQFIRAVRFIFYFVVIMPRRFMLDNKDNDAFHDILFHQTSLRSKN